ncbi:MAG: hypothetical protein U1F57_08250 [bacterium]
MKKAFHPFFLGSVFLTFFLLAACSSSDKTSDTTGGGANTGGAPQTNNNNPNNSSPQGNTPSASGGVVNRVEKAGTISYKIYLQQDANGTNRKGLILLGSGNDENDPTPGSLDDPLENNLANELAKLGYVAAIVAYRDQPPLVPNDNGKSWNDNSEMLAADMSNVANAIIATYGNGLSRAKTLTGGVSYASYSLLTNVGFSRTLADTRGLLAACGATGDYDAKNLKIPIFSLNCSGNPEGDYNGKALIDRIGDPKIKADSGFFTDPACNSHCGGDVNAWTGKLVERVQFWLP